MKVRQEVGKLYAKNLRKGVRFRTFGTYCGQRDWVVLTATKAHDVIFFRALSSDGCDWIGTSLGTDILGSELR